VAAGLFDGLAAFFGERELAGRIGLADAGPSQPMPVEGDGPMYWPPVAPDGPVKLRLTNTGAAAWASGMELVAGWEETDQPYLAFAPEELAPIDIGVPALAPGESVVVDVTLPSPPAARAVAWISLWSGGKTLADHGSPALQLSSKRPELEGSAPFRSTRWYPMHGSGSWVAASVRRCYHASRVRLAIGSGEDLPDRTDGRLVRQR